MSTTLATATGTTDWRLPENRREAFLRFWGFHLNHRSHPGAVYYLLPMLGWKHRWTDEQRAWFAFLNGNTQNPVTSWLLMEASGHDPQNHQGAIDFWNTEYAALAWDTDRRHHKGAFEDAIHSWRAQGGGAGWWKRDSWADLWGAGTSLHSFGRLSTWSFLEFGRILGLHEHDASSLMLGDIAGSRSHRNGLCIVLGHDRYDWHKSNPDFPGYSQDFLWYVNSEAEHLLTEAKQRFNGHQDVTRLTMESTLCTYKSWHRPNRRYPNVYNDLLHDRIRAAERAHPGRDFDPFWSIRADALPKPLRLEANPGDPGVSPIKQNWYRETGEIPMLWVDYPDMRSGFDDGVREGRWKR